jgi:thiamine biosynthesis protein ThiS
VRLFINGQEREIQDGSTVATLLIELGATRDRVAVERNGDIVAKAAYESTLLTGGDRLEVVQFVGGG